MNKAMFIMSIDWGKTIGYSVVDIDTGKVILVGSSEDHNIPLSIFGALIDKIDIIVFESINAPGEQNYKSWLEYIVSACTTYNIKVDTVSPATWKNSFAKKVKPPLTNHAIDSYRMAHYKNFKLLSGN